MSGGRWQARRMTRGRAIGAKSLTAKPKRRHTCRKKMHFQRNFAPSVAFDGDAREYFRINFRWRNSDWRVISRTV